MRYVICYDIVKSGRRRKVANELLDLGDRVQKSAFECDIKTDAALRRLINRLEALIDPSTDTLRAYRICGACLSEARCRGVDLKPAPVKLVII